MRWAISGGKRRSCDWLVIFTANDFLVMRSITVIVFALASIDEMVPAILRKLPETTSSAANSLPSALRVPRARSWSPALIRSIGAGLASSNETESGA